LRIDFFIDPVTIHVRPKVQVFLVELLNRRRDSHGEPDNLVRNELFLQWCAGLGSVIDNAHHIAAIETVRRPVIARIGIAKHGDRHTPEGSCARHGRDVGKELMIDGLEGTFSDLATIFPMASDRIGEVIRRLRNSSEIFCDRLGEERSGAERESDHQDDDKGGISHRVFPHKWGLGLVIQMTVPYES